MTSALFPPILLCCAFDGGMNSFISVMCVHAGFRASRSLIRFWSCPSHSCTFEHSSLPLVIPVCKPAHQPSSQCISLAILRSSTNSEVLFLRFRQALMIRVVWKNESSVLLLLSYSRCLFHLPPFFFLFFRFRTPRVPTFTFSATADARSHE